MSIPPGKPSTNSSYRRRAPRFLRRLLGLARGPDGLAIRKLRTDDLPRFFYPADLTLGERWLGQQECGEMYVAVAEVDGVAVGRSCILYNYNGDPPNAYAFAASVSPEWHSRGIGSALVDHSERVARSRGMYNISEHTAKSNPRAAAWWEQMGYRRVGEETIHWKEVDGRNVESLCWKFERTFTPPTLHRIRRWVRIRVLKWRG
jgi:ribosomal protein S18 acetylase RimI-like enzyme